MALFPKFQTGESAKPANPANDESSCFSSLATLAGITASELNQMEEEYFLHLREFKALEWVDDDDVSVEIKKKCGPEISRLLERVGCLYVELQKRGRNVPVNIPSYMRFDRNFWGGKLCRFVAEAEAMFHPLGGFAVVRTFPEIKEIEKRIDRAFYSPTPKESDVSKALYQFRQIILRTYPRKEGDVTRSVTGHG